MSWSEADQPACNQRTGAVALVIEPRSRDLGGFSVRRVLPSRERKMVGPFIFFDEMGPADFAPGEGINVRPHPHIGLATVTYLFEGEIVHRDSLGFVQAIKPGAVNLMTAGRGIVHSERTRPALLASGQKLHGIQTWMALPLEFELTEPAFEHYAAASLPRFSGPGISGTVIIGSAYGQKSPVATFAETVYLDIGLQAGAEWELPSGVEELAVYVVSGRAAIDDCVIERATLGVLTAGHAASVHAIEAARIVVAGGAHLGDREIWWNFVASTTERIEHAKRDWKAGRFGRVPDDDEFIPLPKDA